MNNYIIGALIVFGLIFGGVIWHNKQISNYKKEIVTQISNEYNSKIIQLQNNADSREAELNKQIEENKGEAIIQRDFIISSYESQLVELRKRPQRQPSSSNSTINSDTGKSTAGATGLQLSDVDSAVLARIGRDTAELQTGLKQCYADYEAVKNALDKFQRENPNRFFSTINP